MQNTKQHSYYFYLSVHKDIKSYVLKHLKSMYI